MAAAAPPAESVGAKRIAKRQAQKAAMREAEAVIDAIRRDGVVPPPATTGLALVTADADGDVVTLGSAAGAITGFPKDDKALCMVHRKIRVMSALVPVVTAADGDGDDIETVYKCRPGSECHTSTERVSCDLCNKQVHDGDLPGHVASQHGPLLDWCEAALSAVTALAEAEPPSEATAAVGAEARKAGAAVDGGRELLEVPAKAREQLAMVVNRAFPKATLFIFGSSTTLGTWNGSSDVDLTLVDIDAAREKKWPPFDEPAAIKKLCAALRDAKFAFDDLEPVLHTRVPVVKREAGHIDAPPSPADFANPEARTIAMEFSRSLSKAEVSQLQNFVGAVELAKDNRSARMRCPSTTKAVEELITFPHHLMPRGLRCTVNFANGVLRPEMFSIAFDLSCRTHGIRNSLLMRRYMEQSSVVRCGYVFIKQWSKRTGVNNPKKGFITSYATSILWCAYLVRTHQVKFVPVDSIPALPNAADACPAYQAMLPENIATDTGFDGRLGRLIVDFFRYYACEFNWESGVVTLVEERPVTKANRGWVESAEVTGDAVKFRDRVWYRACIEDPYEANLNLGRHLSPDKLRKVRAEFAHALACLVRPPPAGSPIGAFLRRRTPDDVEVAVKTAVLRCMIGHKQRPAADVLAEVCAEDKEALAALLVEGTVDGLFQSAGFDVDPVDGHLKRHKHNPAPPPAAAEVAKELGSRLAEAGPVGVACGGRHLQAKLDNFWCTDDHAERFFVSIDARATYVKHKDAIERALRKGGRKTAAGLQTSLEARLGSSFIPGVLTAILTESKSLVKQVDGEYELLPTTAYYQPRSAPAALPPAKAKAVKDAKAATEGVCDECKKQGTVFPATDTNVDGGRYCAGCWGQYES